MPETAPAIRCTGVGPDVLFLHAFPLDSSQWDHQVAALSDAFRCIRADYWGCGASPPPPDGAASLDDYAASLMTALDALGVERFSIVGASMGGYIAFALLRMAVQRLEHIVFANTRATADSESARTDRLELAERLLADDTVEPLVELNVERLLSPEARAEVHVADPLRGRIRRCTPAGAAHALRAMAARPDSSPMLSSIHVPSLVISGERDAVIPRADAVALHDGLVNSQLVTMSTGHLSNLENPPAFNEHVSQFLGAAEAVTL